MMGWPEFIDVDKIKLLPIYYKALYYPGPGYNGF